MPVRATPVLALMLYATWPLPVPEVGDRVIHATLDVAVQALLQLDDDAVMATFPDADSADVREIDVTDALYVQVGVVGVVGVDGVLGPTGDTEHVVQSLLQAPEKDARARTTMTTKQFLPIILTSLATIVAG